jgi:hypothetical protein
MWFAQFVPPGCAILSVSPCSFCYFQYLIKAYLIGLVYKLMIIPFQDEFTSKFTLFMRRLRGILSEEERAGTEIQI